MRTPSKATKQAMIVLLQSPMGLHGYDIIQSTGLGPGTLYPMLARLEDQGMLTSEWQQSKERGRPPRHIYSLSEAGKNLAKTLLDGSDKSQPQNRVDPELA